MHAIADELGVSAGALYTHVTGIAEVAQLVSERLRADLNGFVSTATDWRGWLREFAHAIRKEFDGSMSTLFADTEHRAARIDVGEPGLRLLTDAGLSPIEAAHAIWLVVRVAGTAGDPDRPSFVGFLEPTRRLVETESTGAYRALGQVHHALADGEAHDSFPFDLEVVLEGIAAQMPNLEGATDEP
jgi:AcrR family transcriptional regulator